MQPRISKLAGIKRPFSTEETQHTSRQRTSNISAEAVTQSPEKMQTQASYFPAQISADLDAAYQKLSDKVETLDRTVLSRIKLLPLGEDSTMLQNRLKYSLLRNGKFWTTDDIADVDINKNKSLYSFMNFSANNFMGANKIKHDELNLLSEKTKYRRLKSDFLLKDSVVKHQIDEKENPSFWCDPTQKHLKHGIFSTVEKADQPNQKGRGTFNIDYTPFMWSINAVYREQMDKKLHMSDVVISQYEQTLTKNSNSAYQCYPYIIKIDRVSSIDGKIFMGEEVEKRTRESSPEEFMPTYSPPKLLSLSKTNDLLQRFLAVKANGKSTSHINHNFGLKAFDIEIEPESNSVYVFVKPEFEDNSAQILEKTRNVRAQINF